MPHEKITIDMPDGGWPAQVFTPAGERSWPAVILYLDAGGIRPGSEGR